ncbi:MAG: DUF1566 domain-containing protein [Treponema sp.]|jgi:hypothetical protein|nr:DUF1566 domain-containing protein [Treponema sp.]
MKITVSQNRSVCGACFFQRGCGKKKQLPALPRRIFFVCCLLIVCTAGYARGRREVFEEEYLFEPEEQEQEEPLDALPYSKDYVEEYVEAQPILNQSAMQSRAEKISFERLQYLYRAQELDPDLQETADDIAAFRAAFITPLRIIPPNLAAPSENLDFLKEVARYKAEREQIIAKQRFFLGERDKLLAQRDALLKRQEELLALLKEADDFYAAHPPFELYYDPGLERFGAVNFQQTTMTMRFKVCTVPAANFDAIRIINEGLNGIKTSFNNINRALDNVQIEMDKVNKTAVETYAVLEEKCVRPGDKYVYKENQTLPKWKGGSGRRFTISASLFNEAGKEIGKSSVTMVNDLVGGDIFSPDTAWQYISFSGVKIDDISESLRISITRVNDKVINSDGSGYISITELPLTETDYAFAGFDWQGYGPDGYNRAGYTRDGYNYDGFNRQGKNREGYTREQAALLAAACSMFVINGQNMAAAPAHAEFRADWNEAVKQCAALRVSDIDGWRLPTKDELDAMYEQLYKKGWGGFSPCVYWASSEDKSKKNSAAIQSFVDGEKTDDYKGSTYLVRAVRVFDTVKDK